MTRAGKKSAGCALAFARGRRWFGIAILALCFAGCGRTPGKARYLAERDLWRAGQLERRLALRPAKDDVLLQRVQQAYERVLRGSQPAGAQADPRESMALARIRASAGTSLARTYVSQGNPEKSLRILWGLRDQFPQDLESTLQIHADLLPLLARMQKVDTLAVLLREMAQKLPPATAEGQPISLVMEAPLRLADLLSRSDRATDSGPALEQAFAYYDQITREHGGTAAQVAALVQEANVRLRQNRPAEAETILRQARDLPQAGPYEAGILFSLATVVQQGLKDPLRAVELFREVAETHADDPAAGQALLRMAMAFAEGGRPDSAQASFARCEAAARNDPGLASQARFLAARNLMGSGQTAEGIRSWRSVTADFPRTEAGLQAPLEIAGYYQKAGDKAAAEATLREAEGEYERIVQDLAGTQGQEAVVMGALDRLAIVRTNLENWDGAVDVLTKRADRYPRDAGSPLALVQAAAIKEVRLSDRPGSIALLEKMVERYPSYPLTQKVRDKIAQLRAGS